MSVLAKDNRQLLYIYSCESNFGKEMLAYAQSIDKRIQAVNICNENISQTIWLEIADMIGVRLSELFSPEHPDSPSIGNVDNYIVSDWLKIIKHNPGLLQRPIAINCNKAISIKEKSDMMIFSEELNNKEEERVRW
ncbi:hypothetical protein C7447_103144 [Tenacibaculum adriaticum]|uniref:Arsenate reductase n=1 Tax=Tenacibaculum adriaticum TaxID=413713 RepID=A0A5S5DQ04_9FLAO|nr:hypothetical protein [Tenacibaculum adriaticum]TYP97977.1 hypothetical protein C7447_103144 [Tenacibaculum adriaticum]